MSKKQRARADRLWRAVVAALDYAEREEAARAYTQFVLEVSPT